MNADPTDPLEAERRANRVLRDRVADLERQLKRFGDAGAAALGSTLSEREALLSEAERIAHMGSWVWDVTTDAVHWSDELHRILGYDPSHHKASTETFFDRVHPEDRERVKQTSARGIAEGISHTVNYRVLRPDGTVRHVSMDGALLFDHNSKLVRAVGTVLDVTEARESARRLEHAVFMLAEAQRLGKMGSFEVELETGTTTWSDELFRLADVDPAHNPSVAALMERLHPDDRAAITQRMEQPTTEGEAEPSRVRLIHADGAVLHVEILTVAVKNPSGEPVLLRGTVTDVTDLMKLQAQLHQVQKIEAVGQLAGGLAHDYNNLLTVILGNAELLLERQPSDELHEIVTAAKNGTGITNRLLGFARKTPYRPRPVDLSAELAEAHLLIRRVLGERYQTRMVADPEASWPVLADAGQIQQALLNLALNARDAMPHGGTLTLSTGVKTLSQAAAQPHAAQPGDYATATVADTGMGMDEATRLRVFEPFFTTKAPGHGTGLGLATVFGTMKQVGGFVEVESKPDQGSSFTLYFPRAPNPGARPARPDVPPPHGAVRILLVEDNPAIVKVVSQMLKQAGHPVRVAPDARAALALWAAEPADLLITDVVMPGMSGGELSEAIEKTTPALRTLFITGYAPDDIKLRRAPGRRAVLVKPFRGVELMQAIASLVQSPQR